LHPTPHHDPVRRLLGGIAAAGITATSLFLLLYGFGGMLIAAPHRSLAWPIMALTAGLALIPVWWRRFAAR
jgi:solute:Na+ symporter, SSS family